MTDYKQQLNDLLLATAKQNASDLHIGVGKYPMLRIDGLLIPLQKEGSKRSNLMKIKQNS